METLSLRTWKDLGVVDTIFEEEGEDPSTTPLSPLPLSSPSPNTTPLHSLVEAWSVASGDEIDVVIYVEDSCFYLHKGPLRARSGYMKRQLKDSSSELSVSPPLNITAETFSLVTEFCYGSHIVLTPFNITPLRIAAELQEMTEANGTAPDDNLRQKTETYFRRVVADNEEYATIVLRSGVSLLPEAETTACLVRRCIEALMLMHDGDGDGERAAGDMTCLNDVVKLRADDFQVIVESMNQRLTSHDLLYRIVDFYLKGYDRNITEEQKIRICNYIDCTILSSQVLMDAVQNPRMPLRFVFQAMFVEQLNTRRSIFSAADKHNHIKHQTKDPSTLGALIQRDAALHQVAQLKAAMSTTNSRIRSLEKELSGMRKRLQESENTRNRSQSFRFSSENKIERGQMRSVSSASFRVIASKDDDHRAVAGSSSSDDQESSNRSSLVKKRLGRRLINGLKSALRVSILMLSKKKV
ncbi:hypothetical protein ACH5RR_013970 [Cinchona calisaya]|uniref:Uncharacterized protein n=1 Tax=Cinchona calisaya TaxID=153742 RepID=A0ABD3A246_9GENT